MKKIILIALGLLISIEANARELQYQGGYKPNDTEEDYFNKSNYEYDRSLIYVFFNGNVSCRECQKAIEMLQNVYDNNYQYKYDFYVVDYKNDTDYNYTGAYNLRKPLEVVMVKIENGGSAGYRKIENLQNQTSSQNSFEREFKSKVDSFLRR